MLLPEGNWVHVHLQPREEDRFYSIRLYRDVGEDVQSYHFSEIKSDMEEVFSSEVFFYQVDKVALTRVESSIRLSSSGQNQSQKGNRPLQRIDNDLVVQIETKDVLCDEMTDWIGKWGVRSTSQGMVGDIRSILIHRFGVDLALTEGVDFMLNKGRLRSRESIDRMLHLVRTRCDPILKNEDLSIDSHLDGDLLVVEDRHDDRRLVFEDDQSCYTAGHRDSRKGEVVWLTRFNQTSGFDRLNMYHQKLNIGDFYDRISQFSDDVRQAILHYFL